MKNLISTNIREIVFFGLISLFLIIGLSLNSCKNASGPVIQEFSSQEELDSLFDYMDHQDSLSEDSLLKIQETREFKSTEPSKLKRLVIHCTASNVATPHTKESLLRFFKTERHWSKPGYTFFIDREGIIWKLNEYWDWDPIINYSEVTFGATGYNSTSLHCAWDGGLDGNKILDNRTDKQKASLNTFVKLVRDIYPTIDVLGHRDLPGVTKLCPVFDVRKEYGIVVK